MAQPRPTAAPPESDLVVPRQCKGRNRKTGQRCKQRARVGRDFCKYHGGNVLAGPAHPRYKDGRRGLEKYRLLPPEIQERFRQAATDPQRLELLTHIDVATAKLEHIMATAAQAALQLGKVDPNGKAQASPPWLLLREAWEAVQGSAPDTPARRMAEARLGALVNAGATVDTAWQQWVELLEVTRRLIETQTRRDERLGQFIPADKVQGLVRQVAASVQRRFTELAQALPADQRVLARRALNRVATDLLALIGRPAEAGLVAQGA